MSHDPREQRIGSRYLQRIIIAVVSVLIVLLVVIFWNIITALPWERTTVVVAGDPVQIVSWDQVRGKLAIIPIPADVRIDGVSGVGNLPLASLRKLEVLDPKKKGVFVKSLEDTFALPIMGVTGSGLPFPLRFRLWWIRKQLRPDAVTTVDLGLQGVFRSDVLPDGSQVRVFDANRFDAIIGSQLEVDTIRREELRVRVVNTTDALGLGNRAARILSHAGMVVIAVDSEPPVQNECTIHAKQDLWSRQSVRFVKNVFDCVVNAQDWDERADLTVRLGSVYAQRFTSD